jgi:hypothetical protein
MASRHGCYYRLGHGVRPLKLTQERRRQQYQNETKQRKEENNADGKRDLWLTDGPSKEVTDYEKEASNFNGYEEKEKEEVIFITSS